MDPDSFDTVLDRNKKSQVVGRWLWTVQNI